MAADYRRGAVSFRAVVLLIVVLGAGGFVIGPLSGWSEQLWTANSERHVEFDRRVKAQRHAAIAPELAQAGITVESSPTPAESAVTVPATATKRPHLLRRIALWWHRLRGAPPAPVSQPVIPVLRDSLGLLPGERAFLPGGRVVYYDTTTFHYQAPSQGR